mgnify:FL=1
MDKNRYFQIRSGKYIKTKVADIQRLYSKWLWLVMAVYKPLLTDAETKRTERWKPDLFRYASPIGTKNTQKTRNTTFSILVY